MSKQTLPVSVPMKSFGGDKNLWISPKQNNHDFDYWLLIQLTDFYAEQPEYWGDKDPDHPRYNVSVYAVAPSLLTTKKISDVASCMGIEIEEFSSQPIEHQVVDICAYGISVNLWQDTGHAKTKLVTAAKEQCQTIPTLFGFYMDKFQNRVGATGWDFIKGNIGI